METYQCKLVAENGIIQELFYREGDSKKEILEGLAFWEWPEGTWTITDLDELEQLD